MTIAELKKTQFQYQTLQQSVLGSDLVFLREKAAERTEELGELDSYKQRVAELENLNSRLQLALMTGTGAQIQSAREASEDSYNPSNDEGSSSDSKSTSPVPLQVAQAPPTDGSTGRKRFICRWRINLVSQCGEEMAARSELMYHLMAHAGL